MFSVLMGAFACVISVVALGVAWLTMSACAAGKRQMALLRPELLHGLQELESQIGKTSNATLRVEVDALADALEAHRQSSRSEMGRMWKRIGREEASKPALVDPAEGRELVDGDHFAQMLALQGGKPAA